MAPACAADNHYLRIEGKKQGTFKGEAAGKGKGWIQIVRYEMEVVSPRDPQSGLATGKRQHKPIVITKLVDAASTQILRAATTNEPLEVVIQSSRSGPGGKEEIYHTIKLTNATISRVRKLPRKNNAREEEEEISIAYENMEVTGK